MRRGARRVKSTSCQRTFAFLTTTTRSISTRTTRASTRRSRFQATTRCGAETGRRMSGSSALQLRRHGSAFRATIAIRWSTSTLKCRRTKSTQCVVTRCCTSFASLARLTPPLPPFLPSFLPLRLSLGIHLRMLPRTPSSPSHGMVILVTPRSSARRVAVAVRGRTSGQRWKTMVMMMMTKTTKRRRSKRSVHARHSVVSGRWAHSIHDQRKNLPKSASQHETNRRTNCSTKTPNAKRTLLTALSTAASFTFPTRPQSSAVLRVPSRRSVLPLLSRAWPGSSTFVCHCFKVLSLSHSPRHLLLSFSCPLLVSPPFTSATSTASSCSSPACRRRRVK